MIEFSCDYICVSQPIGDFYCVKMKAKALFDMSYSDIRRMESKSVDGIDNYLGIQRQLSPARVEKIKEYITSVDATFPNSIIVAVPERFTRVRGGKIIFSYEKNNLGKVAKILDGQHRLAGFNNDNFTFLDVNGMVRDFELLVTVFINADLHTQAQVFTMVNQNQTKVNKSLVYDLESLAIARSPYRTAHQIAVAINGKNGSPFYRRIKRLGFKQNGVDSQLLTQAAFVENLVKLISRKPSLDRDILLGKKKGFFSVKKAKLPDNDIASFKRLPLRKLFLNENDPSIAVNVVSYYKVIEKKWPSSWSWENRKSTLNKTVGLIATMRFFRDVINHLVEEMGYSYGEVIELSDFEIIFNKIRIEDSFFDNLESTSKTSGFIYKSIKNASGI